MNEITIKVKSLSKDWGGHADNPLGGMVRKHLVIFRVSGNDFFFNGRHRVRSLAGKVGFRT